MTAKKKEPRPALLKYGRDLQLMEQDPGTLTLGDLKALLAEAADKGFSDFSRVRVMSGSFLGIQYIYITAV